MIMTPPRLKRTYTVLPTTNVYRSLVCCLTGNRPAADLHRSRRPDTLEKWRQQTHRFITRPWRQLLDQFLGQAQIEFRLGQFDLRWRRSEEHSSELKSLMRISFPILSL